ncbi:MAG TPA: bifunctional (p)ppGpp synthetase/guanosine-3',5'-bis(diphosphate) 3'-pyrophosphohydrolase [Candidatus Atribacteria bacterium]|nr:bifunctional (p)ppGpp synthetase/guanosine-3',5'-bis(diphosphate) 3'-pyrophosphohydrolase [Candidatus Atribacteria bacterium]
MLEKLQHELETKIEKAYGPSVAEKIGEVCDFVIKAHEGQKRSSGEPYSIHPIEVAKILIDMGMDVDTITAGLLHDTIEDTDTTQEELEKRFGSEVAMLVDGVTKLSRLSYKTKEEQQVENLRKMFLAMAKDIRVIIIKLADRLHNLRTLEYVDEEKQREKAYETLEIYAPLAHRLGIYKIKWELEDISLRFIDPKGYYDLVEKVAKKRREREAHIQEVIDTLKQKLSDIVGDFDIEGRPKNFYSIYKKMYMQHKEFEQIYDLLAVRILVNNIKDCYGVLGVVHTLWKPIPGRFKDYIAVPKPNMYQSLHTTVIGPHGDPIEIQIRTWEMHRTAEYGIAAHWKYKEGRRTSYDMDKKFAWLRQLLEWQNDQSDAREFMESLKIELFTDEVFVFTPRGDVIDLPKGATPLDFAYAIHSAIGNRCIGAKVNGKIVPLEYELRTGEIVEILTSPSTSHGPSRDWLKIVKTSQAKNKIRQWFKKEKREENIEKGKEMLEREAKRQGFVLSQLVKNEWVEGIFRKYGFHTLDDMYSAVGYGGLTTNQVLTRLIEEYRKSNDTAEPAGLVPKETRPVREKSSSDNGVRVKGIDNVLVRFAKCCNPVPGDPIIGYITRGRGVSVHRADCINLTDQAVEANRLVEVSWAAESKASYNAEIQIIARDRQAILADITNALAEIKINVTAINARTAKNKLAIINLVLEIHDTHQLEKVIKFFGRVKDVLDVFRVNA